MIQKDRKIILNEKMLNKVIILLIVIVILGGMFVRVRSVRSMSYQCSTHDLGTMDIQNPEDDEEYEGHLGYIYYIYYHGHLPQMDPRSKLSFYNPPFFYLTEAAVMKGLSYVGVSKNTVFEGLQWATMFFTTFGVIALLMTLYALGIRGISLLLASTLLSFHPVFTQLSLSVNPDGMAFMFSAFIILFSVLWYKKPKLWKSILLALCFGLGMMTKLSVALLAPGTAFLFLLVFIKGRANGNIVSRVGLGIQYVIFLIISVPLGLFWSIRNMIRFHMSLTYIPSMSSVEWLNIYQQDLSLWKRLGIPLLSTFQNIHLISAPDGQYNIWAQTFKTALVDEKYLVCEAQSWQFLLHLVLYGSILLAIILNVMLIWSMVRKGTIKKEFKIFIIINYVFIVGQYIVFCFQYPQTCTMNFRYIPITLIFPCIGGALAWQHSRNNIGKKIVFGVTAALVLAISIGSAILYWYQLNPSIIS